MSYYTNYKKSIDNESTEITFKDVLFWAVGVALFLVLMYGVFRWTMPLHYRMTHEEQVRETVVEVLVEQGLVPGEAGVPVEAR